MAKEIEKIEDRMILDVETIKEQSSYIQDEVKLWASYNKENKELGISIIESAIERIEETLNRIKKDFEKLKKEGS